MQQGRAKDPVGEIELGLSSDNTNQPEYQCHERQAVGIDDAGSTRDTEFGDVEKGIAPAPEHEEVCASAVLGQIAGGILPKGMIPGDVINRIEEENQTGDKAGQKRSEEQEAARTVDLVPVEERRHQLVRIDLRGRRR